MPCREGFDNSAEVLVTQVALFVSVKAQKPEAYYTIKQLPFRETSLETKDSDSGTVHDCVIHCDSICVICPGKTHHISRCISGTLCEPEA